MLFKPHLGRLRGSERASKWSFRTTLGIVMARKNASKELISGKNPKESEEIFDELPDDLNAVEYVGPYQFPDNKRRRVPAYMYLGVGAILLALWLASRSNGGSLINRGFGLGGALLIALGLYGLKAGPAMVVTDTDALAAASAQIGFPVGHASAQLGWRGLASRPTWRILVYSAENPPTKRGLVLVDGIDGKVVADMVEDNPEDWSQFED
jgi:hypothetical protein